MKTFKQNIINLYGEKGNHWLSDLPRLIKQAEATHGLSDLKPVKSLSYNYVLSGFQGSQAIILKLGLDIEGIKREAAALKAFSGFGVVEILSDSHGLLLLMRAIPGFSLKSHFPENDDEAIHLTVNVIKRLHQAPVPHTRAFPHIKDWLTALDSDLKISVQILQKARELRDQLLKTAGPDVLLHGDLHHDNILKNGQDWVVIDPKGVIGERAYEIAAFIRNPMPDLLSLHNAAEIIKNRITRFAKLLDLPSERIHSWCLVQAVLSWVWAIEDGCDTGYFEETTKIFFELIKA